MEPTESRKILFLLPSGRFEDISYQKTRTVLERYGHSVRVASPKKASIFGLNKMQVLPDFSLEEVRLEDYDALVLGGGIGYRELWDLPSALELVRQASEKGLLLGGIGNGPVLLARAGVLKGRKATGIFGESKEIKAGGAEYTSASVTQDANVVTAKEVAMADQYALGLVKALKEKTLADPSPR